MRAMRFRIPAILILALASACTGDINRGHLLIATTFRASVGSGGTQGSEASDDPAITPDGRFVAFRSNAGELVPGDTNNAADVFLHDTLAGITERISVSSSGAQTIGGSSSQPALSADGRFVAFTSSATNLVTGDGNNKYDVFLRDRALGTTVRISVDTSGGDSDNDSYTPAISADGRYVAFASWATDLVVGDTNAAGDIFVRDMLLGTTARVSLSASGLQGDGTCERPSITADGAHVAFRSASTNLVAGDTNGNGDMFVRVDWVSGSATTERVSTSSAGAQANYGAFTGMISSDGRYVVFYSGATDLVPGDSNGSNDVFVKDRLTGATTRVSVHTDGSQAAGESLLASISADGRFVVFESMAANLVDNDGNGVRDVFVRDTAENLTFRASVRTYGVEPSYPTPPAQGSGEPAISADGRYVAFRSDALDLVDKDTNGAMDVFVRGPLR